MAILVSVLCGLLVWEEIRVNRLYSVYDEAIRVIAHERERQQSLDLLRGQMVRQADRLTEFEYQEREREKREGRTWAGVSR